MSTVKHYWNIMTDFAPMVPQQHGSSSSTMPTSASTPTSSTTPVPSSDGGGWIALLFFGVPIGTGYLLVRAFVPEANEPLGWITFGFGAMGAMAVSAFFLLLVACGVVAVVRFTCRALGRGLVKLGVWMVDRSRPRASAVD